MLGSRKVGPAIVLMVGIALIGAAIVVARTQARSNQHDRQRSTAPGARSGRVPSSRSAAVSQRGDAGGVPSTHAQGAVPAVVRLRAQHQRLIDETAEGAIERDRMPGAVVLIGRRDGVVFRRAYGARSLRPERAIMQENTIFDLASLTKAVATATSVMLLVERGRLKLDEPVAKHLPEVSHPEQRQITVRQLLLHSSGVPAASPLADCAQGPAHLLDRIARVRLVSPPGERYLYSDIGFILLGELVKRVAGKDLARFAADEIFSPLAMHDTGFNPALARRERAAPTERRDGGWLLGQVHDPRAARLAGVAGHAGLFSTADDLARFARMLLGRGQLDGVRILGPETVRLLTTAQRIGNEVRGLGWDMPDGPAVMSKGSYGHRGFTGTSLWIDPERDLFVVFLSSRLHPDGRGEVKDVARRVRQIAVSAGPTILPASARQPPVLSGIDVLRRDGFAPLRGARVGLITNASGRARDGKSTLDLLVAEPSVQVVALLAPEHGLDASSEGPIADGRDSRTGLPVQALYGKRQRPTPAGLRGVDTLVFDVQDVGARFFTYATTMRYAMQTAAEHDLRFVVLDRINPIDGATVEGPVVDTDQLSFVNSHPLPVRHGMTVGELAQLFNAELAIGTRLEVIKLEGWRRQDRFDDTDLPWFNPSPNLTGSRQALLYPAIGLLERTNLSVGRGTDCPFELVGAPWLDAERLAQRLEEHRLPGVTFEATHFTPTASPYRGQRCAGIRIRVTQPVRLRAVRTGLSIARELLGLHASDWQYERVGELLGSRTALDALRRGDPVDAIEAGWEPELGAFRKRRQRYLLY